MASPSAPLATVVIPCFNHAKFLPTALHSVHRQTWPAVESIVIDDGSTDASSEVAAAHGATRVERQANRGLARARNAGLDLARGEFVVFLDADDELLPDAVATGIEALERAPQAGCVVRCCRLMDEVGAPLPFTHTPLETADLYRELLHCNFVWTPGAAVFRTARVREFGGFPEGAAAAADYALLLRLARRGMVVRDPREVVRYRKHSASMSADPVLMLRHVLAVLDRETRQLPPEYQPAWHEGRRRWRAFYGDRIFERLRKEWRGDRRPAILAGGIAFLLRQCPAETLTHIGRKLRRVSRGLPSEGDGPGESGSTVLP